MNSMLLGAIAMASLVAALFFLRFWTETHDRFFLFFALAFFVEALNRAALGVTTVRADQEPFFYLVRLCAFGLIIVAILEKNRVIASHKKRPQHQPPASAPETSESAQAASRVPSASSPANAEGDAETRSW